MLGRALSDDRWDYILALYLGRFAGLRIHECFRIDTATAEQALRENAITIKGKGGKGFASYTGMLLAGTQEPHFYK